MAKVERLGEWREPRRGDGAHSTDLTGYLGENIGRLATKSAGQEVLGVLQCVRDTIRASARYPNETAAGSLLTKETAVDRAHGL